MKIEELMHKIDSFPGDLLSPRDLVSLGMIKGVTDISTLVQREDRLPCFMFCRSLRRFLKKDVLDFIWTHFNENEFEEEYDPSRIINRRPNKYKKSKPKIISYSRDAHYEIAKKRLQEFVECFLLLKNKK